jgi:hypothetical protein
MSDELLVSAPEEAESTKPTWKMYGEVESVDKGSGLITLWLETHEGVHTVPITADMPDWLLVPGAKFGTAIPRKNVRGRRITSDMSFGEFTIPENIDLSLEEVWEQLATLCEESRQ